MYYIIYASTFTTFFDLQSHGWVDFFFVLLILGIFATCIGNDLAIFFDLYIFVLFFLSAVLPNILFTILRIIYRSNTGCKGKRPVRIHVTLSLPLSFPFREYSQKKNSSDQRKRKYKSWPQFGKGMAFPCLDDGE